MKRVVVPLLNIRAHFMDFINTDKLFSLQKSKIFHGAGHSPRDAFSKTTPRHHRSVVWPVLHLWCGFALTSNSVDSQIPGLGLCHDPLEFVP